MYNSVSLHADQKNRQYSFKAEFRGYNWNDDDSVIGSKDDRYLSIEIAETVFDDEGRYLAENRHSSNIHLNAQSKEAFIKAMQDAINDEAVKE